MQCAAETDHCKKNGTTGANGNPSFVVDFAVQSSLLSEHVYNAQTSGAKKRKLADPDFRPLPFSYSLSLSFQQFGANVFEHKCCALDPNLARQYRVLIFDAHDALEADIHVSFYDILPELRAMTISNRAEDD